MTVLVWFGLVLWAAATAVKAEVPCNKADRPNIVIFMADDLVSPWEEEREYLKDLITGICFRALKTCPTVSMRIT